MPAVAEAEAPSPNGTSAATDGSFLTSRPLVTRRAAIGGGLAGLAGLGGLMMFPGQILAREAVAKATVATAAVTNAVPADPFIILLRGLHKPVVNPPNLSLSSVKLDDGSYSTTKIYPQRGVPGHTDETKAIGNFFVQFAGALCAYNLPQGLDGDALREGFRLRFDDPRRERWQLAGRELRPDDHRSDRDLPTVCRWPQRDGRHPPFTRRQELR
jgi:hypothetical protein